MSFKPELGQAAFGNGLWEQHDTPGYVSAGIVLIAQEIARFRGTEALLATNDGDAEFFNDVFTMRTYCWCDGGTHSRPEGCPPNFDHPSSGIHVRWYKHARRGTSINRKVSPQGWTQVQAECLASIPDGVCAHEGKEFKTHPWAEGNPAFNNYWECAGCGAYGFAKEAKENVS